MFWKKQISILIFVLCQSQFLISQDLAKDMSDVIYSMDSLSTVSIKVKIAVYSRKGGSRTYTAKASIQRNKNSSLNILGDQENFDNPKYSISVDHEEKTILIQKKSSRESRANEAPDASDVRKLQKLLASSEDDKKSVKSVIKLISNASGIRRYSITNLEGIKEVQIVLDMNTLAIQHVSYQYTEQSEYKGQYITLDYTEFSKGGDLSGVLSTSRYFTTEKDKYILKSPYKGYHLYTEL